MARNINRLAVAAVAVLAALKVPVAVAAEVVIEGQVALVPVVLLQGVPWEIAPAAIVAEEPAHKPV